MTIPPATSADLEFNPPPNWPAPAGFDPRRGHTVDPTWPEPPIGWTFWTKSAKQASGSWITRVGRRRLLSGTLTTLIAIFFLIQHFTTASIPSGVGSCWAPVGSSTEKFEPVRCGSTEAMYKVEKLVSNAADCPDTSEGYFEDNGKFLCASSAK
jgi:hypothetical protein